MARLLRVGIPRNELLLILEVKMFSLIGYAFLGYMIGLFIVSCAPEEGSNE